MSQFIEQEFLSRGELMWPTGSHPATLRCSFHRFQPNSFQFTLVSEQPEEWSNIAQYGEVSDAEFRGTTDDGESIRLWGLRNTSTTFTWPRASVKVQGYADLFAKGDFSECDSSQGYTRALAFIPSVSDLIPSSTSGFLPDGTIIHQPPGDEHITWQTSLGQAVLIECSINIPGRIGSEETVQRVRRHAVQIEAHEMGIFSLAALLTGLGDEIDEPLWLISFLIRKRIAWYSAEVEFIGHENLDPRIYKHVVAQRQCWLGNEQWAGKNSQHWSLVHQQALADGLFQKMVSEFTQSQYKEVIHRTIVYIIVSYEPGYVESSIGSSYLALESMIAGFSSEDDAEVGSMLCSNDFKRVSKQLRKAIDESVPDRGAALIMKAKLSELNRRPLLDKLLVLLARYNVPTAKIWSEETDLREVLHGIIRRRNMYIHKGTVSDQKQYYADMTQLRYLIELWLLKVLGCPDESINNLSLTQIF